MRALTNLLHLYENGELRNNHVMKEKERLFESMRYNLLRRKLRMKMEANYRTTAKENFQSRSKQ